MGKGAVRLVVVTLVVGGVEVFELDEGVIGGESETVYECMHFVCNKTYLMDRTLE